MINAAPLVVATVYIAQEEHCMYRICVQFVGPWVNILIYDFTCKKMKNGKQEQSSLCLKAIGSKSAEGLRSADSINKRRWRAQPL